LREENEELLRLQQEGFFKFALRVEPLDFQAFAAVMALGNRKAAAEALHVPARTVYGRVDSWRFRGKDYQRMFRMVEWRKATGRKIQVRLEDSLMSGEPGEGENPETLGDVLLKIRQDDADAKSYPDLLRLVLQALREQNAENWASVKKELVDILSEEV
jgi:hypothetical protein